MGDAAKRARKKLLARLGIASKDLLGQCMQPAAQAGISKKEYNMFWEQVDGPDESTWLLCEMANQLNRHIESGTLPRSSSQGEGSLSGGAGGGGGGMLGGVNGSGVPLESVLHTFAFCVLTLEILTADRRVKEVLGHWQRIEQTQKQTSQQHPLFTQVKEVYRIFTMRVDNHELLGPVLLNCISMYGSIREYERMMDVMNHATVEESTDLTGGESCFYYEYLKRLAMVGQAFPNTTSIGKTPLPPGAPSTPPSPEKMFYAILSNTVSKLVTLPQQMKMNPKVAETTCSALFHLLRNLLALQPIIDTNFLRMTMTTLQPFFLWPQPYGSATRDLLIQLQLEMFMPGTIMRTRVEQEVHTTAYVDESASSSGGTTQPDLCSGLFYIHATDDKAAQSYVNILDLKPFKLQTARKSPYSSKDTPIPALLTPTVMALTLLNLLASDPYTAPGVESDATAMRQVASEAVFIMYRKMQEMLKATQEHTMESKEIRNKFLVELRMAIQAAARAGDKQNLVRLPEKLVAPYTPAPPSMLHLSIPVPTSNASSSFQFDPREQWRMLGHKAAPFVSVPLFENLVSLCQMYRDPTRTIPLTLRIMIGGGDELLHQVVCAWVSLRHTRPEVLEGLAVQFGLLPFGSTRNHLAAFIARHDAWYNRHIFLPSRAQPFMVPWVRAESSGGDNEATSGAASATSTSGSAAAASAGMLSPSSAAAAASVEEEGVEVTPVGSFLRKSFESYARESSLTINPFLYQLEGYLTADSEGLKPDLKAKQPPIPGPDHLIPFIQRAELGILPAAAEYKKTKRLGVSVSPEDIVQGNHPSARGFEYSTPIELMVSFTRMDLAGRIVEMVHEDPATYQQLLLTTVPRNTDPTFPPLPTAPYMELFGRFHKSDKTGKQANMARKSILMADPRQHVVELEVTAANPNQTFGIMIDNQYFGPYYKVKLLPCFEPQPTTPAANAAATPSSPNNATPPVIQGPPKRMTFPIQHFFPMDI